MAKIIAAKKSSIGVSCFIIRHANHPATASTSSHQKYQYVNPTNYINQTGGYVQIKWAELSSSNFPSSTPSRMNNQSSAITRPQAERMREHPGGQAARLRSSGMLAVKRHACRSQRLLGLDLRLWGEHIGLLVWASRLCLNLALHLKHPIKSHFAPWRYQVP